MSSVGLKEIEESRTDVVFGVLAVGLFALAAWQTTQWEFRTALFPRIVTVTGLVMSLLFLAAALIHRARRRSVGDPGPANSVPQIVDEDGEHDHEVEYVFATVGRVAWTQALAWVAVLLLVLVLAGLFVASALFSLTYLRWAAMRSWRFAAIYAATLTGVLYVSLRVLLVVPVPSGIFG